MFDFSLHNILHSNIVNAIALFIILGFLVKKADVAGSLEKIKNDVIHKIKKLDEEKTQASKDLEKTKYAFANVDNEILMMEKNSTKEFNQANDKMVADFEKSLVNLNLNLSKQLESYSDRLNKELEKEVIEDAFLLAEKEISDVVNEEIQEELVDEFLRNIEEVNIQ